MAFTYHPSLVAYYAEATKPPKVVKKRAKPHKVFILLNDHFKSRSSTTAEFMCERRTGMSLFKFMDSPLPYNLVETNDKIETLFDLFDAAKDRNTAIVLQLFKAGFTLDWVADVLNHRREYIERLIIYRYQENNRIST
jgi:hypothetical protein